ncbi:Bifunctional hemolysin/adenylate cyclase precursor [Roseivivax jejudonensis]|uniref:Bifunctional hemolysin/adenylate cyclase n=1 Tax=Roseivivax jejudonensis TaxID=1529041 RepID=A0A1X6ZNN2_9RHOB|nr:calcium-binding protein [Roseivivax jejudonensis]SLN56708.1 Bifunctional hemolysin/adenylate cyclase precursor [Roseivivax jejudonensis]
MPIAFWASGRVSGEGLGTPAGPVALSVVESGGATAIAVADHVFGGTITLNRESGGLVRAPGIDGHGGGTLRPVDLGGTTERLPQAVIDTALAHLDAGGGTGQATYLAPGGRAADRATVVAAHTESGSVLFVALADGSGIAAVTLSSSGRPTSTRMLTDTGARNVDAVADLALIETGQGTFLYAGSATEHGISGFRVTASGALQDADHLGMMDGLPITTVSALAPASTGGRDFLIVAASGSSSLSVLSVAPNGRLTATDQVIDTRDSRFQGATLVETVTVAGQVFVTAAGMDEGLTLFRLTAEGRLVHVATLIEDGSGRLDDIVALAALPTATGAIVATRAEGAPGVHLFTLDIGTPGSVARVASGTLSGTPGADLLSLGAGSGTLAGGAGDDVLSDGAGSDTLRGGAGHDTFVLTPDGRPDTIADVRVGHDLIDLSAFPFLYEVDRMAVAPTPTGAVLRVGGEDLRLYSADGTTLTAAHVAALVTLDTHHVSVTSGPITIATPEPTPDPFPDSVPRPVMPDDPAGPSGPSGGPGDGGAGASVLRGTDGADRIVGTAWADTLAGLSGPDTLIGAGGNDVIAASDGDDRVEGGEGRDNIGGGTGDDTLLGQGGRDTLGGGYGDDRLEGGWDHDVMAAGPGADLLIGGPGDDTMGAGYQHDTVQGNGGADSIGGGTGRDMLAGHDGDDAIGGGEGDDTVKGGAGDDFLAGGGRDDRVEGGPGADRLNGGAGNDVLEGGPGADRFVFNTFVDGERDVIVDFEPGVDRLALRGVPGEGLAGKMAALTIEAADGGARVVIDGHAIVLNGVTPDTMLPQEFLFL